MEYAVELKNICLNFKDRMILDKINFTAESGSITGIAGLSGAGKTSFIRIINGNIGNDANAKTEGEVLLFGIDTKNKENNDVTASVYQDPDTQIIFPNVTDEIVFGMENSCLKKKDMQKRLDDVSHRFGIEHLLDKNPNNLSGGEKQLVVLASVICVLPKILLLDECMSQMDKNHKAMVKDVLLELKGDGTAIIMVEHNNDNLEICDRILLIKNGGLHPINEGIAL